MQVVVANGLRQHVLLTGPDKGQALVFINSLGSDFRIWDEIVEKLPDGIGVLRYDMRGHGLSSVVTEPCNMGLLARDLAELLDVLDVRKCLLVGISIGGIVAQRFAIDYPGLVDAMLLAHTSSRIGNNQFWDERITQIKQQGLEANADSIIARWFTADYMTTHHHECRAWRRMLCQTPLSGYIACCHALAGTDLGHELPNLTDVETLVVGGEMDLATPPGHSRKLASSISGARYVEIAGAAHLSCIEKPDVFSELLMDFMDGVGWTAGSIQAG